jgi:hypothetical protein
MKVTLYVYRYTITVTFSVYINTILPARANLGPGINTTLSSHHPLSTLYPAFEDGTDRGFRNVGRSQSDAGEIPKRTHTTIIVTLYAYQNTSKATFHVHNSTIKVTFYVCTSTIRVTHY